MKLKKRLKKKALWRCEPCDRAFGSKHLLQRHLDTVLHSGGLKLPCPHCERVYCRKDILSAHVRNMHPDLPEEVKPPSPPQKKQKKKEAPVVKVVVEEEDKPYECRDCGLRFRLANTLKCHRRRHTGERPYKCPYCPWAFRQSTPLNTHMLKVHGKVEAGGRRRRRMLSAAAAQAAKEEQSEVVVEEEAIPEDVRPLTTPLGKVWQCKICGMRMRHKNQLNGHQNIHKQRKMSRKAKLQMRRLKRKMNRGGGGGMLPEVEGVPPEADYLLQEEEQFEFEYSNGLEDEEEELEEMVELEEEEAVDPEELWPRPPSILEIPFDDDDEEEEEVEEVKIEDVKKDVEEVKIPPSNGTTTAAAAVAPVKYEAICSVCRRQFGNHGALGFHQKKKHPWLFQQGQLLLDHTIKKSSSGMVVYKCQECDFEANKESMAAHLLTHQQSNGNGNGDEGPWRL